MISVVICSRSNFYYNNIERNIAETIEMEYEIIRIENDQNQKSISGAYNQGASQSKYPIICFAHEDILFSRKGWGKLLSEYFQSDQYIGIIGPAGAVYKSGMPCGWWQAEQGTPEIRRMKIIHKSNDGAEETLYANPGMEKLSQVAVLDGVFLATSKAVWELNRFDEKILSGFHGYDLDFSLSVGRTKKLMVTYELGIVHFSSGKKNRDWMDALLLVHEKWHNLLPVSTPDFKLSAFDSYSNDVKRLHKNLRQYRHYEKRIWPLIRLHHRYFKLLKQRPNIAVWLWDYTRGVYRLLRQSLTNEAT
ncbi:MAG TPA: glycosyltransferase [Panacibacter sp.]|nr:glycosyltransferase [Panacibacter sp.]HNP46540.1 glycosyltransferase [Panacibacter sp.]